MQIDGKIRRKSIYLLSLLGVAGALILACSTVTKDVARQTIGNAETAVRQSSASDVQRHAPLEAKKAEDKLSRAKSAFENEDYVDAKYLADEAMLDARLAEARADNAKTEAIVRTLKESIEDLRHEIDSQTAVEQ